MALVPPGSGSMPEPSLCQSVLGSHWLTLLFVMAPGAGQPGRPVLLEESP